jgi:hypothetical protein
VIFQPQGPFKVPTKNRMIDRSALPEFWDEMDRVCPELPGARGCYIFVLKAGRGAKPWYVGLSAKGCFKGEVLAHHKIVLMNEMMVGRKGTLLVYLLGHMTPSGRFRKKPIGGKSNQVRFMENALISMCLRRNPDLLNKKQTAYLRDMRVPGFMNDGRGARTREAKSLAKVIGT